MKYFFIFIGSTVLFVVGFLMITAPTVKSLSECLSSYNSIMANNITTAKQEKWSKETVCRNGQPPIINLQSCYSSVGAKSILPFDVVFTVAKIIRPGSMGGDIKEAIKLHNSSCLGYPETQVQ